MAKIFTIAMSAPPDDASFEKNRLEEKQRAARREMKKSKEEFKPL